MKKPPLAGRRIAVTRARDRASELTARLATLGAEVIELPLIAITKQVDREVWEEVVAEFGSYDWLVFTSANGVRGFFDEFHRQFDDIRALGLIRIAAVGEATAAAIREQHLRIECQPAKATAAALAEELVATGSLDSAKVLVVTGNLNRDDLARKLEAARAIVDRLPVYRTERTDLAADAAAADFRARGADAVLFASSSAVQSFVDQAAALALAAGAKRPLAGSMGPQTSATMREAGMTVDFEAESPGLDGLIEAVVRKLAP
jgi:uroporphyrinogen-III synthase